MVSHQGTDLVHRVSEVAKNLGYDTIMEPSASSRRSFWKIRRGAAHGIANCRPDILIEGGDKSVVVEVKAGPVLLGGVIQARKCSERFNTPAILCVPDESFNRIPGSVKDFAKQSNVRLCSFSGFGSALETLMR